MLAKRIIPCLDVDSKGQVVKCINYKDPKTAGDPVELAIYYYKEGADELVFLDIAASIESRELMKDLIKKVAQNIFIPFTVGGGIKTVADMKELLKAGADKVSICTSAVKDPGLIRKGAYKFGSQCIVVSIDVKKNHKKNNWEVYIYGGRKNTGIDAAKFAKKSEKLGAGEILLNSLDRDGTNKGYDLEILKKISNSVGIPVIASSGAGNPEQILEGFTKGCADAALAASIFHYKRYSIREVKKYLRERGVEVRL
ncbi:imidazole glycerol phosphate synthase subunit HisF [Candidatus Woesearchaeota archaeon]|nr:imidazole glycerol phosphate synthase subunit HisF [Candidatus Woesearchaeota archaeon]